MTIVDRVVERIKQQPLGDLISEEDLHDIVKEAIPKAFFEARWKVEGSGYNERRTQLEPALVECLRDNLKTYVDEQVKQWVVDNGEAIAEYWQKVMDEGIMAYTQRMIDERTKSQIAIALRPLMDSLNEERQRAGMMPIYL